MYNYQVIRTYKCIILSHVGTTLSKISICILLNSRFYGMNKYLLTAWYNTVLQSYYERYWVESIKTFLTEC